MHFCGDEATAIIYSVPFVGMFVAWIKVKIHHLKNHSDCKKEKE